MFICNFALQISFLVSVFNKGEIGCLLFIDQSLSSEEIRDGFSPVPGSLWPGLEDTKQDGPSIFITEKQVRSLRGC